MSLKLGLFEKRPDLRFEVPLQVKACKRKMSGYYVSEVDLLAEVGRIILGACAVYVARRYAIQSADMLQKR